MRAIYLVPPLAFVALAAWALASPLGASPDDNFHLVSIWCANDAKPDCSPGPTADTRVVPQAVLQSGCYIREPERSAACQYDSVSLDPDVTVVAELGNFRGGYPPLFYATMSAFVGDNILLSAVTMRLVNALLFVALTTALFILLPRARRPALAWGWLISTIPLALFIIPSNNPSSWAVMGVGTGWLALLGWFETTGRTKVGLGVVFAVATVMAAGARSDAAAYAVLGMGLVVVLKFAASRRFFLNAILPFGLTLVCAAFVLTSPQSLSAVNGFGGAGGAQGEQMDGFALLAYNILNIPSLWAGALGTWGLGWFDTDMPALVAFGSIGCFIAIAFIGFGSLDRRKAIALAILGFALVAVPVYVLTRGGDPVGAQVQPRYVLPLIVMFAGLLVLSAGSRVFRLRRGQLILIVVTLSAIQFVALHVNMRRYITGVDANGLSLDAGAEWWWSMPLSPMTVLIVGSLAYAACVAIVAREVSGRRAVAALDNGAVL
jgi:hypothetical protein